MFSFVSSCVKWAALCLWLVVGAVSFLAAQNLSRQVDAVQAEVVQYRGQLMAAQAELTASRQIRDDAVETAAKWRTKFEAICQQVQSLSVDVTAFVQ
jgi:hypothetical protein